MGGNIRKSILRFIDHVTPNIYLVLELSSFQLDSIHYSPHIGVFTSFFPDHLDRYDSLDAYFESKTHIVTFQRNTDIAVLNIDNDRIAVLSKNLNSQVLTYSLHNNQANMYIVNDTIMYQGTSIMSIQDIPIRGEHNQYNVMAAIQVALKVNIPVDAIIQAVITFKGVEGRQQSLGMVQGVEIINDTTSTMPVALGVALDTFKDTPHIVICGGNNKVLDYSILSHHIHPTLKGIVLLPGSGSDLIRQYMVGVPIYDVTSLDEAIDKAFTLVSPGERIVFSPGATSFGMFLNEFDRGDKFVEAINKRK
jgi:UDP-N-acetylmuramoylalanine--D-glutamate ligase